MSNTLSKEDENELKAYMDEYHKHAVATEIAKLEQYIAYKAQQEAIGFAEWVDGSGYTRLENDCWGSLSDFKDNKKTSDLYNLYKSKEK